MSKGLFNETFLLLEKVLDVRLKTHNYTAANIANIDTPNYRPRQISFDEQLKSALYPQGPLKRTHPRHFSVAPETVATVPVELNTYYSPSRGLDTADIDQEMVKLAKNQLMYNANAQILARKFQDLKNAIMEGGR
jgi:flagellar basal-body rod protein FlgB